MPEPLRGKDEFQNQIRHPTETKITIETQSQDLRNPANSDTLDESKIVHLGKDFQMILWHMSVMNLTSNSISLVHTHQDLMAKQKILTNFLKPQFANSVRKTMLHGIKYLTRSYSHTDVVLTLQLVKHHILCSISETYPYQFTN